MSSDDYVHGCTTYDSTPSIELVFDGLFRHSFVRNGFSLVSIPWCAIAYSEDDLMGDSRYIRFWCLYRDRAYNECAWNEYSLFGPDHLLDQLNNKYVLKTEDPYLCTIR